MFLKFCRTAPRGASYFQPVDRPSANSLGLMVWIHLINNLEMNMLLATELADEFAKMRDGFFDEIQPKDAIETNYVENVAYHTLEIVRYQFRIKLCSIRSAGLRFKGLTSLSVVAAGTPATADRFS